jgi:MoaA/NifB/PqqE/SkfB family radical SAM enzyme
MRLDPLNTSQNLKRRTSWLTDQWTGKKALNALMAVLEYGAKREVMRAWPLVLKIDISPLCNLKCTICVHASPNDNEALKQQEFTAAQRMSVDQFRRIVDEVKGRTSAISMYYFGDPLMHPQLAELCGVAFEAGLNTHVKSNFSFTLSSEKLERLATSGLTHLCVCVDGLTQANYERTRVGGKIDLVLSNLSRICEIKRRLGSPYPHIEAQFIKFRHNVHEFEKAKTLFKSLGVNRVTSFWGDLGNYTDDPVHGVDALQPRSNRLLPQCYWPHFTMLIRYNGDVVPCANYRIGEQSMASGDRRIIGNVFETSVREVWNSPGYQAIRRLVSNPSRARSENGLRKSFCDGCAAVFQKDRQSYLRDGKDYNFEDLYDLRGGIPVRKVAASARLLPVLREPPADGRVPLA